MVEKQEKGDWQAIEEAMLEMRERGGLDGNISQLDDTQRHVRAMTDLFLAESYRFREANDSRVDKYYNEALQIFRESQTEDDDWNIPWRPKTNIGDD